MTEDWKSEKTTEQFRVMWEKAKLSRLLSITMISLAWATITSHFIMSVLLRLNKSKRYRSYGYNSTQRLRPLYWNADFFYNVQENPQYEITWILQFFASCYAGSAFSSSDAFFTVLVLHLCAQLKNLREQIRFLPRLVTSNKEYFIKSISEIVSKHGDLTRFAKAIEDTFSSIFLIQMIASSMTLCLQGYQMVMIITTGDKIPLMELIFMIYFTLCYVFSLFVYCYVAEVLQTESTGVGNAAYESDWYDLEHTETKLLILIMVRTKQPFQITAGKFAAFSMDLYCNILKSSGKYLSMLLAVKDRLA